MSTLIIKNDGIGDLVLCSGLLADLAEQLGPVDLVTCSPNREIAENTPGLRTVYYVSRDQIRYQPFLARLGIRWVGGTEQDREVFSHLRAHHYTTAICLRRYIRQSSLVLMTKVRAERKECCWRWVTNAPPELAQELSAGWDQFEGTDADHSELEHFRRFARERLGISSASPPRLKCTDGVVARPEGGRVGLCLSGDAKNWPHSAWKGLATALLKQGKSLVLFGGGDAIQRAAEIAALDPRIVNHAARLTFAASVPELARLELLISNDNGFAHFAGIVVSRLLVILGGGTHDHFFPWPEAPNHFVIYNGMDCFGCNWHCRYARRECFAQITPRQVLDYANAALVGEAEPTRNVGEAVPGMRQRSAPAEP